MFSLLCDLVMFNITDFLSDPIPSEVLTGIFDTNVILILCTLNVWKM